MSNMTTLFETLRQFFQANPLEDCEDWMSALFRGWYDTYADENNIEQTRRTINSCQNLLTFLEVLHNAHIEHVSKKTFRWAKLTYDLHHLLLESMLPNVTEKNCLQCGKLIKGRIDRKFCTDWCRSTYHNNLHQDAYEIKRRVNTKLLKNRQILKRILLPDKTERRIKQEQLLKKGYDFDYLTYCTNKTVKGYFLCCYEYGFRHLDEDYLLIVKLNLLPDLA